MGTGKKTLAQYILLLIAVLGSIIAAAICT